MLLFLFAEKLSQTLQEKKKAVVTVETRTAVASSSLGRATGTGFFINKNKGYILTNRHVARGNTVTSIEIITSQGRRRLEAKHIFSHPFLDFSILKVDPNKISEMGETIEEISMNTKLPKLNEDVLIYSNSEANKFSIHHGEISNLYESMGHFPVEAIRISVVARGGASGAPVLNDKGEVIGLIFAGSATSLWAVPMSYIKDVYEKIEKNEEVITGDLGIITDFLPIDDAIDSYSYPKDEASNYIKTFGEKTLNRMLVVDTVKNSSPAINLVLPGDIIDSVDDQKVGASHYMLDKAINTSLQKNQEVKFVLWRNGKKIEAKIKPRIAFEPKRYLKFGGATIVESGELGYMLFNAPLKKPVITMIEQGTMFDGVFPNISGWYYLAIEAIDGEPINTFDELEAKIKQLSKDPKSAHNMTIRNMAVFQGYDSALYLNRFAATTQMRIRIPNDRMIQKFTIKKTADGDDWVAEII